MLSKSGAALKLLVLLALAAAGAPRLDVGIVLSGRFGQNSGSGRLDLAAEHSAVISALSADKASFATALCYPMDDVGLDAQPAVAAALRSAAGLNVVFTQTNAAIDPSIRSWYPLQFQRLDQCFLAFEAWGRRHGRIFSHYIRLRPDTFWVGPMQRVSALPPDAISLRARELFANYTLSDVALSWNDWCMKRHDCGALDITPTRYHSVQRHRPCVVPDDQWAVIPAHLAPVYFNTSGRTAPSSTLPPISSPGLGASEAAEAQERGGGYHVVTVSSSSRPPRCAAPNCYKYFETKTSRGEMWGEGYLATRLHASDTEVKLAVVEAPLRMMRFKEGFPPGYPGVLRGVVRSCNVECATEWELEWWKRKSDKLKAKLRRTNTIDARRRSERCAAP